MIDKRSSASGHDYASDRSAIGAGSDMHRGNNTTNRLILICVITYDTQQLSAADDSWSMNDIVMTSTGFNSKMSIEF